MACKFLRYATGRTDTPIAIPAAAGPRGARVAGVQRLDAQPDHLPRLQPGLPPSVRLSAALPLLPRRHQTRAETRRTSIHSRPGHLGGGTEDLGGRPGDLVRGPGHLGRHQGHLGRRSAGRGRRADDRGGRAQAERCRHSDVPHRRSLTRRRSLAVISVDYSRKVYHSQG